MELNKIFSQYGLKYTPPYEDKVKKTVEKYYGIGAGRTYGGYISTKNMVMCEILGERAKIKIIDQNLYKEKFQLTETELKIHLLTEGEIRFNPTDFTRWKEGNVPVMFVRVGGMLYRSRLKLDITNKAEEFDEVCAEYKLKRTFNKEKAVIETFEYVDNQVSKLVWKLNESVQMERLSEQLNEEFDKILDPDNEVRKRVL